MYNLVKMDPKKPVLNLFDKQPLYTQQQPQQQQQQPINLFALARQRPMQVQQSQVQGQQSQVQGYPKLTVAQAREHENAINQMATNMPSSFSVPRPNGGKRSRSSKKRGRKSVHRRKKTIHRKKSYKKRC